MAQLATLLQDRHLPSLEALELPYMRRVGDDTASAKALEMRKADGMRPLTSIKGVSEWEADSLRRTWAFCPLEQTTHLDTGDEGGMQLEVLAELLEGHASRFAELRSLTLGGEGGEEDVSRIITKLAQGGAPKLEKVRFGSASLGLNELVEAMRQGTSPALSSLDFYYSEFANANADFTALMGGLQAHQGLRQLYILETDLALGDYARLATALKDENGGLAQLEEFKLADRSTSLGAVLEALVDGVPCARTLIHHELATWEVDETTLDRFIQHFASIAFPRLCVLELSV